jgi:glucose-1-phosphate cytidylyltransferase
MKTVILAGGLGTRLSEKTADCPKPMVEIGGKPMLWHIMNIYASYGFEEFVLATGYKSELVKDYFLNFYALNNNLTIDLGNGDTVIHEGSHPRWKVHLVDTGLHTQTGGRLKRLSSWIEGETFMMTYGDGVANVDILKLLAFHKSHGKLATITAVRPPSRFGGLSLQGEMVKEFMEKPLTGEGWINGGYFVLEPKVLDYIEDDKSIWERGPLERLAKEGELAAYRHGDFWQPMDTLREHSLLEEMWGSKKAPWKVWV